VLGRMQNADLHVLVQRILHASGGSLLLVHQSLNGKACGMLVARQWITTNHGANITTSTRTTTNRTLMIGAIAYTVVDPTQASTLSRMVASGSRHRHVCRSLTTKVHITLGAQPPTTTRLGAPIQIHMLGLGHIAHMAASTTRTVRPTKSQLAVCRAQTARRRLKS
jgi:hypothetical protein